MSNPKKAQTIAVTYRVIDLKKAFINMRDHHANQVMLHPVGEQGLHEIFQRQACDALRIVETEGWRDQDVIVLPDIPSEFVTAVTPSDKGLKTFEQYYRDNRLVFISAKDSVRLIPR